MRDARAAFQAASFRLRLIALAAGLLVPAVVCMSLVLLAELRESRARFEQELLATTRALSSSVDRQLGEAAAINETLASSVILASGDWAGLAARARAVQKGRPGWFILTGPDGQQLVNTHEPQTPPLPPGTKPAVNIELAAATGGTRVSDLAVGRRVKRFVVAVNTPLVHVGRRFNLGYVFEPSAFLPLFAEQRLADGRFAILLDRKFRIVARSRHYETTVGRFAEGSVIPILARSPEGLGKSASIENQPTIFAYSRSAANGYTTVVAVPRREVDAVVRRSALRIAAVSLALLVLGIVLSWVVSRGLARPLRALVEDARALGRGKAVAARDSGVAELQAIQDALSHASAELAAREQRQRLLVNELNHRVKNTLATVQALAGQSFGRGGNDPESLADFNARILALAGAHDLLTAANWGMTSLEEVLERTAGPSKERFMLAGPTILLAPQAAVALSMMAHELTTNSLKYGALSAPGGDVLVEWGLGEAGVDLVWSERGGPLVSPPTRRGFGTRLIERLAAQEFEGSASHDYRPEGLVFKAKLVVREASEAPGTMA